MNNVLIVEDDLLTSEILCAAMKDAGLKAITATTIEMGWREIKRACPDLIVLDLGLPDGNGINFAKDIRNFCASVGILVVTAKTDAVDVVLGLELGADDYVKKPFLPREISARARAILRRINEPAATVATNIIKFGRWQLDIQTRQLTDEEHQEVVLTRAEFDLLKYLLESSGRVQSREQLLSIISNQSEEITDRTVDVIVGRLRRKLQDSTTQPMILTVRGVGYRMAVTAQPKIAHHG